MILPLAGECIWVDQVGRYFRGFIRDSNNYPLIYNAIVVRCLVSARGTDGYTYVARQIYPERQYYDRFFEDDLVEPMT